MLRGSDDDRAWEGEGGAGGRIFRTQGTRLKRIDRVVDTPETAKDFLVFAPLELHLGFTDARSGGGCGTTGVTVMPVGGNKFGGEPVFGEGLRHGGAQSLAPLTSSAVAVTVPAPGFTLVEYAQGVGAPRAIEGPPRAAGCQRSR